MKQSNAHLFSILKSAAFSSRRVAACTGALLLLSTMAFSTIGPWKSIGLVTLDRWDHPNTINEVTTPPWNGQDRIPWILDNFQANPDDHHVGEMVKKCFQTYQASGVNMIRLVIAPHWPGWCGNNYQPQTNPGGQPNGIQSIYLSTVSNEPPAHSEFPRPSTDRKNKLIAFMNLAYSYGLKTDLMLCTHDPGDNNVFFYSDHTPDKTFISAYITAINYAIDHNQLDVKSIGQIELAAEILPGYEDPTDHKFYWPDDPNWTRLTNPLPTGVWQQDLPKNHWAYIQDIWNAVKPINTKNFPLTFNLICCKCQDGPACLTQSKMSTLAKFLINKFPGIASASIELYISPKYTGQTWLTPETKWQAYRDTTLALLNAYNTGSIPSGKTRPPLFVSEFTLEPGTDGAFTWSKIDQEEYYHGILEAANLFSGNVSLSPFNAGVQTDRGELFQSYNSENFPVPTAAWNWFCKYYNPSTAAMQISIGSGGQIFALGYGISGNQYPLLQWDNTSNSWAPFHNSYGFRVAVDPSGTKPYLLKSDFSLDQWNGSTWSIIYPLATAFEMNVGKDGTLYMIDLWGRIFKRTVNGMLTKIPPNPLTTATPIKIATDFSWTLYTITSDGLMWQFNPPSTWIQFTDWMANDFAFGSATPEMYMIGTDWSANDEGYNLYYRPNFQSGFTAIAGGAGMQVAMDGSNNPWVIKSNGAVWHRSGSTWVQAPNYFDPKAFFKIACKSNINQCLDVTNGIFANGTALQIWARTNGNQNQEFKFIDQGAGYYSIICRKNTTPLYAVDNSGIYANGTKMRIYTYNSSNDNQKFKLIPDGSGYYSIQCKGNTNYSLDNSGSTANGTKVILQPNNSNSDNQKLLISTVP